MKRILLLALIALFATLNVASAQNQKHLTLSSGSLDELNDANATIFVVYNYDKETLNGKSVVDFIAEKPKKRSMESIKEERAEAEEIFTETFNATSNTIKAVTDQSKATYILTIDFADLNYGNVAAGILTSIPGAGNAKLDATVTITKDGANVATIDVKDLSMESLDKKSTRGVEYMGLADAIVKAIKKTDK